MEMRKTKRGRRRSVGDAAVLRDNELIAISGSKTCRVIAFKDPFFSMWFATGGAC